MKTKKPTHPVEPSHPTPADPNEDWRTRLALIVETMRVPEPRSSTVLETRAGAVDATSALVNASLGGDFKVCHFSPGSLAMTRRPASSLAPLGERTP